LGYGTGSIQYAEWPKAHGWAADARAEAAFSAAAQARNLRATYNLPSNKRLRWLLQPSEPWVEGETGVLSVLLNAEAIEIVTERPAGSVASCPSPIGLLLLPLEGIIDPESEKTRLAGEIKKVEVEIKKVQGKLSSESFVNGAPAEVVAEHRAREASWKGRLEALRDAVASLG
jgi:valyl-tRNA synthetase